MAWKQLVLLVHLTWIFEVTEGNDVLCAFSGQCTLPCSIDPHGGDEVIHWYHTKNNEHPVHSYYKGEDHLEYQDPKYKGRTSLSLTDIPLGKASLSIKDVRISDEGRYKCYTSTGKGNEETFVNVKVYAPVNSVDLTLAPDTLTCSAKGVYPAPTLVWSTVPPSDVQVGPPDIKTNAQGLYIVNSTVPKTSNTTYVCNVTAGESTQTVSFRQWSLQAKNNENLIIPCNVPQTNLKEFTLIWLFNGDPVLTFNSHKSHIQVHKQWQNHVKYKAQQTSLELHNLNDGILNGEYECEVLTDDFRYMEQTSVSAKSSIKGSQASLAAGLGLGIGIAILAVILIVGFVFKKYFKQTEAVL